MSDTFSVSGTATFLLYWSNKNIVCKNNDFNHSYSNNKLYTGFHINNTTEKIYIYNGEVVIDTYNVGKLNSYVSSGITDNKRVFYKNITLGKENSSVYYSGYTNTPIFNINGGYVENGTKIKLSADGDIYYTLDGTFPTKNSTKYMGEITINKNTVIKAIAYKDGYIESDVISRTYIVGRHHDVAFVSISAPSNNLSSLLVNYRQEQEYKVSFEFYQEDGSLGTGFIGGIKLTGMDSREKSQKSMAIYLRKKYVINSTGMYVKYIIKNKSDKTLGAKFAVEYNISNIFFNITRPASVLNIFSCTLLTAEAGALSSYRFTRKSASTKIW